jgi:hypothetical protein
VGGGGPYYRLGVWDVGVTGEGMGGVFMCTNKVKDGVGFNCVFVINLIMQGHLFVNMELF